jgi:hypothetical protein
MSTLKGAIVVVKYGHAQGKPSVAYSVTEGGVHEEPWLIAGLREQAQAWGFVKNDADQSIPGSVGFDGSFPAGVTRGYHVGGDAPGACCSVGEIWVKDHWQAEPARDEYVYAAWESCDVQPYPSHLRWSNGAELWERVECTKRGKRSVMFRDPEGRQRSPRQRQHDARCGGEPRLEGAMSGVALPDGGLLLAGNDCRTHSATTEYFPQGALRSKLIALPGKPGPIYSGHVATSDPVWWHRAEGGEVYVVFPAASGKLPPRPYMARFDGKTWKDLSPPTSASGIPTSFGAMPDGSLWLSTTPSHSPEGVRSQLWFDRSGKGDRYEEILATLNVDIGESGPWESPRGEPWLLAVDEGNRSSLLHHATDGWKLLPLPTTCASCRPGRRVSLNNLTFLGDAPVLALGGEACGCVARLGGDAQTGRP